MHDEQVLKGWWGIGMVRTWFRQTHRPENQRNRVGPHIVPTARARTLVERQCSSAPGAV